MLSACIEFDYTATQAVARDFWRDRNSGKRIGNCSANTLMSRTEQKKRKGREKRRKKEKDVNLGIPLEASYILAGEMSAKILRSIQISLNQFRLSRMFFDNLPTPGKPRLYLWTSQCL
jgi:hypothetical protein